MSRFKKICLIILVVFIALQIPGVYTYYKTYRLDQEIKSTQLRIAKSNRYDVYVGVAHVHSNLGGHSSGTFEELIEAAKQNQLDFVIMNEHVSHEFDTAQKTLREKHGKTLFLGGNELSSKDGDRFLVTEGKESFGDLDSPTNKTLLDYAEEKNQLLIHAYPEKRPGRRLIGDGVEVFSLHTNAKKMNPVSFLYVAFWNFRSYPSLTLAQYFERPDENLRRYDETTENRRFLMFSGVDAHSNIGLRLTDDANNAWLSLKFDDYSSIFRLVRNHVLLPKEEELTKQNLIDALKEGRSYISFDILGNGEGFGFHASVNDEVFSLGSEVEFEDGIELSVVSPTNARIVLLRNGKKVLEKSDVKSVNYVAGRPGVYRVEIFRDDLGGSFTEMPWILSNPIYIR